ncbi:alpha/beta family hydrolase [Catenuloplanes sp. NPDC051500]|uniref:alpha/beta hydrolase family protein n=1 Tax=Catenuloplanes sp. NPDC051500 TaxID=3363959 RepID=UPI0037AFB90A
MHSLTIGTARGPARVDIDTPEAAPVSLLVLGHGAGGGVDAPDLVALRDAAREARVTVARVTQPYRMAGRRAPAPAGHLDEAFTEVVRHLRAEHPGPLLLGGRSSGSRVACRTALALDAAAIVALAFPLHPPGKPEKSRAPELATGLPTLVINGDRDAFGVPEAGGTVEVLVRPGETHDLKRDPPGIAAAVVGWLRGRGWAE